METYSFLREFADSWFMLFMLVFFLGVILWVLFGKSESYRETAESIFRNEDAPAPDPVTTERAGAAKGKESET